MKTLQNSLVRVAKISGATAVTSDLISNICDMGNCDSALAIVNFEYTTHSVTDLRFWTSSSDTCGVTGTEQTATTNTVSVDISSDDDSMQAWSGTNTAATALTVTSDIASIAQDCVIAVELPDIRRYLYAQWNGAGTGSTIGITFIGRDGSGDVSAGARAGY